MSYSLRLIASMNVDKVKSKRETNAYHLLVVVLAKRASATCISSKAIFKLLSSGPIPKTPAFRNPRSVTTYSYSCG
jgi:hypothetical protein